MAMSAHDLNRLTKHERRLERKKSLTAADSEESIKGTKDAPEKRMVSRRGRGSLSGASKGAPSGEAGAEASSVEGGAGSTSGALSGPAAGGEVPEAEVGAGAATEGVVQQAEEAVPVLQPTMDASKRPTGGGSLVRV